MRKEGKASGQKEVSKLDIGARSLVLEFGPTRPFSEMISISIAMIWSVSQRMLVISFA